MSTLKEQMESLTRGIESSTRERKASVVNCRVATHKLLKTFGKERAVATAAIAATLAEGRSERESGDVAMRHDLHRAALSRRRWTKNISTSIASLLTSFTKERAAGTKERIKETKAQHVSLMKSRRQLAHDVTAMMNKISAAHREMGNGLADGLQAYMRVARSQAAALHGSFMAPAAFQPALAVHGHAEAGSMHSPAVVVHHRSHDGHNDRHKPKRKA
jgi:hypothetical protein